MDARAPRARRRCCRRRNRDWRRARRPARAGNRSRTNAAEPSVEPLSTTSVSNSTPRWAATASRHACRCCRPFQLTTMTLVSIMAGPSRRHRPPPAAYTSKVACAVRAQVKPAARAVPAAASAARRARHRRRPHAARSVHAVHVRWIDEDAGVAEHLRDRRRTRGDRPPCRAPSPRAPAGRTLRRATDRPAPWRRGRARRAGRRSPRPARSPPRARPAAAARACSASTRPRSIAREHQGQAGRRPARRRSASTASRTTARFRRWCRSPTCSTNGGAISDAAGAPRSKRGTTPSGTTAMRSSGMRVGGVDLRRRERRIGHHSRRRPRAGAIERPPQPVAPVGIPLGMALVAHVVNRHHDRCADADRCRVGGRVQQIDAGAPGRAAAGPRASTRDWWADATAPARARRRAARRRPTPEHDQLEGRPQRAERRHQGR